MKIMDTDTIGRWIIGIGIAIVCIGGLVWAAGKLGLPLGHLPGDIQIAREKYGVYFPIVSSIVISILLTIILNIVIWLMRK